MKPLETITVLDLTEGNPYIGSVFADYGAPVLKVERPQGGDSIRRRGSIAVNEEGSYSRYYLRGKKSMAIDYSTEAGQEIIRRLAGKCDMVVTNSKEDELKKLGLGYEDLKEVNPKLVYGTLTPFGNEGPWADCPDYDLIVMAKCGLLEKTGFPEKPTKFGFPLAYIYASWHLTAGMMAAYLDSLETGKGTKVDVSSWHTMMELDDTFAECLQGLNVLPRRLGNGFPTTNPTDTFKCKDGWFALSIGSDKQWLDFAREAGRDDWGENSVYAHDPVRSMEHYFGELDKQLVDYFATITINEADQICRRAMVPGGPCNTVAELMKDEQVAERGMMITVGGETQVGVPAKFSSTTELDDIEAGHELGADTDAVLVEFGLK